MTRTSSTDAALPLAPLALAFACVGANGLSTIAADTIFVSVFSLGDLSRFLGVAAVVRVVASLVYAAAVDRIAGDDPRRAGALDSAVVAVTIVLLGASAVVARSESPAILYALCLAQLLLPPLLPLIAFNAITSLLAARQAKRVLPLVAAAATIGSIATSAAATYLAPRTGVPTLFWMGALLCAPAVPILARLGAQALPEPSGPPSLAKPSFFQTLRETGADIRNVPAVRIVVSMGLLGTMIANFVDFSFKASLKEAYDRDQMAAVLGTFGVIANAVVLAMQVLITGRLVGRIGVGRSLLAGPLLVGGAGLASAALPPVLGTGAVRLTEFAVRFGIGNSVADVLLVPLARSVRTRAKIVVKGSAAPLGGLASAAILTAFGEAGPGRWLQIALIVSSALLLGLAVRGAPRAYAAALAAALARGRVSEDVPPEAIALFRAEVERMLASCVREGRADDARRTLDLMTDRFFSPLDVAPALAANDPAIRRHAVTTAARLTGPRDGAALLALVPPDPDPTIEVMLLGAAREHGTLADMARTAAAIERPDPSSSEAAADLWAEALLHRALLGRAQKEAGGGAPAQTLIDQSLKQLRKAATGADSPQRAAALRAIGLFGDRRAEREVLIAMGSREPAVFQEAARAAVLLDASGAVSSLVARLVAGPHPAIAARCLALAGPRAVRELVQALPVTRGEGAVAPTAVAEGRAVSGTARAARALARIGEGAAKEVLRLFGSLGHRARVAVAHAFGATNLKVGATDRDLIEAAMTTLVDYGESIVGHTRAAKSGGLLAYELAQRLGDTREAVLDLLGVVEDRRTVARARLALAGAGRSRDDALELLEATLPQGLGRRFVGLCGGAESAVERPPAPLDGWLEKCSKLDRGELGLGDPMAGVLEKVLLLRDVPLFQGLSGEELYPVAEIATLETAEPGSTIVTQGEASDDLYVVAHGEVTIIKDGEPIGTLGAGKAFGELGVLDGAPRAATIRAKDAARLLRIPRVELEGLLDESPELAKGIIRTLLGYVRSGKAG
ncbi:MAG: cyclic nucleotide-binding domain-containing protein [Myxococcales bacterium]|nr:cyclic nucleotide-binding domain-containing protein [Myxococcales bacterium]